MDQLKIPFNITNQIEHPTRQNYLVFHFKDEDKANAFQSALEEAKLFYERAEQEEYEGIRYLFGVRKSDVDEVEKINYTILGKGRAKLIKDKGARWFILGFGLLMIILAIIGAVMKK